MTFNVADVNEDDIFDRFPALSSYPEYETLRAAHPEDAGKIMKYIILYYDPGSPINSLSDEVGKNKTEAAKLAGFLMMKNKFARDDEKLLTGGDKVVNSAIIRYLRNLKSTKYSRLMMYTDALYGELEKLKNNDGDTMKTTLAIDELERRIEALKLDFLSGDISDGLVFDLYSHLESDELGITPEEVAVTINPFIDWQENQ